MTVCVAVAGGALLLVYDTSAFFHSRAETVAAVVISWFAVGSPLLGLMSTGRATGGGYSDRGSGGGAGRDWEGTSGGLSLCRGVFLAPASPSVDGSI